MRTAALVLVALAGLCSGLQPGLQYHYRYSGRLATGIMESRHQVAGAGIQADVEVQVVEDYTAIFQFSHVQVGDIHDELHCDKRAPLPIEYHRLENGVALLEKPFKVKIDKNKKPFFFEFLEVPVEPAWITNIRKAVVNIFRITPFGEQQSATAEPRPDVVTQLNFGVMEETIVGRCTNWYGIHKFAEDETNIYNREQEIEGDVQREDIESGSLTGAKGSKGAKGQKTSKTPSKTASKTASKTSSKTSKTSPGRYTAGGPPLSTTLWHVQKTVDFERCEYSVSMQANVRPDEMDHLHRSSIATFIIRGDSNAMRIEKAYIEGEITVYTLDLSEHYDTFTNQTLELKAVRIVEEPLVIDYEPHHCGSWRYEIEHSIADHHAAGTQPSLEQILTGVELTAAVRQEVKTLVISLIEDLSHRMPRNPTHTVNIADEMSHIVEGVSILYTQGLTEIHNKYKAEKPTDFNVKLHIFYQALVASATEPSIQLLLTLIPQENFRNLYGDIVYNFFSSLPKTTVSPTLIPKIMEVVMQLPWPGNAKADKSVALISFSNLVGRMCFHADKRAYFWENTCEKEHICDLVTVSNIFIPYLRRGIEDEASPIWQRIIYLQAMVHLRTPFTLDTLRPYILGTKFYNSIFRANALWGLCARYLPTLAEPEVMSIMMPIFENIQESHDIRSIAFLVMASWQRNPSWWSRMAYATWNDPSRKVANLISTTIKTSAHMEDGGSLAKVTAKVEHLIKPAAPASLSNSVNYYFLEYLHSSRLNKPISFAWLASSESIIPEKVAIKLSGTVLFGFPNEFLTEAHLILGQNIFRKLAEMYRPDSSKVGQDAIDIVTEMYEGLKEKLGFQPVTGPESALIMSFQKDMLFILGSEAQWMLLPLPQRALNTPHYTRNRESFVTFPTDIGLPFVVWHTIESGWWIEVSKLPGATYGKSSMKVTVDASSSFLVEIMTLVPWSNKFAVGVTSKADASILLPFQVHFTLNPLVKEVQVTLEPITDDKVHLLDGHNKPYTVLYGSFPTNVRFQTSVYKDIQKLEDCLYHDNFQVFPSVAGLSVELEWEGDKRNPFTIWSLFKGQYFRSVNTNKRWEIHLLYDPENSDTKSITITLTYVSTDKTSGGVVSGEQTTGQDNGDYTQISQSSSGFDYSQLSQSSSSDVQQFGGDADEFVQEHSATRARIAKLQQEVIPATGGHVRSVSIDFDLQGSTNLKYALLFTWATGASSSKYHNKIQITWIKDVPVGTLGEPHSTCLNLKVAKPSFQPFATAEEVMGTDFHSTFSIDLHDGIDCNLPPILDIEGTMDISPEQMEDARKKLSTEECNMTEMQTIDLITTSLYDQINVRAHWTPELSVSMKNWTYFAYDLVRGIYFPNIHYDYTVLNSESEVIIDAHRCLETQEWHIHTTKEHEVSVLENVRAPYFVDVFTAPAPAGETLQYDFLNGRKTQACVITHDKVRTFDGVEFPYAPEACWHVVTMDITEFVTGTLEVRFQEGQWESRWLAPNEGLMVEITPTSIRVNGEDYTEDDRFDAVFTSDGVIIRWNFLTGSTFKMTNDAIYLLEDNYFRSKLGGLCGNFDGEKSQDLIGPKGCIYTNPDLFVKAWTTPGEGCSGFNYLGKKRPVEAYQEACPTVSHPPTGQTYPDLIADPCTVWNYIEKVDGDRKCRSVVPVPLCDSGCHPSHRETIQVRYDCELVPEAKDCAPKCYIDTLETVVEPYCVRG